MTTNFRKSLLFRTLLISVSLNALMILMGTVGDLVKPLSWLAKLSGMIAAPPGFLIRLLIQPKLHSVAAIVAAMIEGLFGSIIFYTVAAWIVLRLLTLRRGPEIDGSRG
jgi:hypothetical protein